MSLWILLKKEKISTKSFFLTINCWLNHCFYFQKIWKKVLLFRKKLRTDFTLKTFLNFSKKWHNWNLRILKSKVMKRWIKKLWTKFRNTWKVLFRMYINKECWPMEKRLKKVKKWKEIYCWLFKHWKTMVALARLINIKKEFVHIIKLIF